MNPRRTLGALSLACCALLARGAPARANGRFPTAQQVLLGPGTSSRIIVLRVTFGLLVSRDGGGTFRWHCEELLYEPFPLPFTIDPPVEITRFGTVVYGFDNGISAITDGCSATPQADLANRHIIDLASTPDGGTVFAIDGTLGMPGRILRAPANTLRFVPTGRPLDGVRLTTLDVAPTDARRLYLSGADAVGNPLLLRSDDGGATVRALAPAADLGDETFVAGVDPTDAEVVYVRTSRGLGSSLLRSGDGGEHFETVGRTADLMLGFALSDDGRTVWYGSGNGGLHRSDDGGRTFLPVSAAPIFCLKQHQGSLWACSDWQRTGYALGRSADGGRSFTPALRWADVPGPPDCPGGSGAARVCAERWKGAQAQILFPKVDDDGGAPAPLDAGAPGIDAGAATPPTSDGCACALSRPLGGAGRGGFLAAIAALVSGARLGRRRSSPRVPTRRQT